MKGNLMEINEAMEKLINDGETRDMLSAKLKVSNGMLSHYVKGTNAPRLDTAARLWGEYGLIVEPFTEKAIIKKWLSLCQK